MATTVAVRRFDPASMREADWATYHVHVKPTQTVLDALLAIVEEQDPTLAFRRTCRSAICGACSALVNGRPQLLCQMLVRDATSERGEMPVSADIVIEPLSHFRVLRDLVVDIDPFLGALERLKAWIVPAPDYDGTMRPEVLQRLWSSATCILCGICASDASGGPDAAALIKVLRFAHDPRDADASARLEMLRELRIVRGDFADRVRAVCPKEVDVRRLIPGPPTRQPRWGESPGPPAE